MTATRARITEPHRRLRLAGTVAGVGLKSVLAGHGTDARRRRAQVCGAARLLTAAGVRVRVVAPPTAWPRSGRLVVSGSLGRLDELAVLTAVPRSATGWTQLAERALLGRAVTPPPPDRPEEALLPVAVRYRREGDPGWLSGAFVPRDLAHALAVPGLVVEVRLLPALRPGREARPEAAAG